MSKFNRIRGEPDILDMLLNNSKKAMIISELRTARIVLSGNILNKNEQIKNRPCCGRSLNQHEYKTETVILKTKAFVICRKKLLFV